MTVDDLIRKLSRFKKSIPTNVKDLTVDYVGDKSYIKIKLKGKIDDPDPKDI